MRTIIVLVLISMMCLGLYQFLSQSNIEVVKDCKVLELQQQQLIEGTDGNMSTRIRYLVITDKETFICENSLLNGKFNNSDIFWRLKKDSIYTFKVAGVGKSFVTEYRNILEVDSKQSQISWEKTENFIQ